MAREIPRSPEELEAMGVKPEIKELKEDTKEKIDQIFLGEGIGVIEGLKEKVPEVEEILKEKSEEEIKEAVAAKARDKGFLKKLGKYARTFFLGAAILLGGEFGLARERKEVVQDIVKIEEIVKKTGKEVPTLIAEVNAFRASKNGITVETCESYFKIIKERELPSGPRTSFYIDLDKDGKLEGAAFIREKLGTDLDEMVTSDLLWGVIHKGVFEKEELDRFSAGYREKFQDAPSIFYLDYEGEKITHVDFKEGSITERKFGEEQGWGREKGLQALFEMTIEQTKEKFEIK